MIKYDTFLDLCLEHSSRVRFLRRFVDEVLATGPKGYVHNVLIGSAIKKFRSQEAFWGVLSNMPEEDVFRTFHESDYDFAVKLDSFTIERLLRKYPSLKEKETEDSDEYGKERLLKHVYTITVGDLISGNPEILSLMEMFDKSVKAGSKSLSRTRESYFTELLKSKSFLQQEIQFLFVKDLNAIERLWETIPADTFATHLWKKSPYFIGKEALKATFAIFESLAAREDFSGRAYATPSSYATIGPIEVQIGVQNVGDQNNDLANAIANFEGVFDAPDPVGEAF